MTHPPHRPGAMPPQVRRFLTHFDNLAVTLSVASIVLLLSFAFTSIPVEGQQPPGAWEALFWGATWVTLAGCGLSALLPRGLVLCVRPELIAPYAGFSVVRRWPRRMGVAYLWGGAGMIALAVLPLTLVNTLAQGAMPHINFVIWAIVAAVAFAPGYGLMLASLLVRRAPRQAAE
jgi:hypothetical protein